MTTPARDTEDRLRHVIAFFMKEAEDEAQARMNTEAINVRLVQQLGEMRRAEKALQEEHGKAMALMSDLSVVYQRSHPNAIPARDDEHLHMRLVRMVESWGQVRQAYLRLFGEYPNDPDKSLPDSVIAMLERAAAARDRCSMCDHEMSLHDFEDGRGCRQVLAGKIRCPCDSSVMTEDMEARDDPRTER